MGLVDGRGKERGTKVVLKHPCPEGPLSLPPRGWFILLPQLPLSYPLRSLPRVNKECGCGRRRGAGGEGRRGNHSQLFSNRLLTLVNSGSAAEATTTTAATAADHAAMSAVAATRRGRGREPPRRAAKSSPSRSSQLLSSPSPFWGMG